MKPFITLLAFIPALVFASIEHAPPMFNYADDKAVFVDFQNARYEIVYDVLNKSVAVESTIEFDAPDAGYPIFDLVADPTEVILDGKVITTEATPDPDKQTTIRVMQQKISAGTHELKIKHKLTTNVVFAENAVASGFWMSDLNDRRYLEQYLPSNLEFDQYQMDMKVQIVGTDLSHSLKANGTVSRIAENSFEISFPEFYSASSVYFHLFRENNFASNIQFYYPSIDGRLIPVDIYTIYDANEFAEATKTFLAELENDYGPFPHNQLIIYGNAPSGGMEYAGATITSFRALGHELMHSYHARALMPANGNAGWMDEAIARWRDNKYPLTEKLNFESTRVAGHSLWSRMTDRMAYTEGSAFLSWIAYRMNEKNLSFKTFLKDYFQEYKYTTVTTQLFQQELSEASGLDLSADFAKYVYGQSSTMKMKKMKQKLHFHEENPFHPVYTEKQLLELTWL